MCCADGWLRWALAWLIQDCITDVAEPLWCNMNCTESPAPWLRLWAVFDESGGSIEAGEEAGQPGIGTGGRP